MLGLLVGHHLAKLHGKSHVCKEQHCQEGTENKEVRLVEILPVILSLPCMKRLWPSALPVSMFLFGGREKYGWLEAGAAVCSLRVSVHKVFLLEDEGTIGLGRRTLGHAAGGFGKNKKKNVELFGAQDACGSTCQS